MIKMKKLKCFCAFSNLVSYVISYGGNPAISSIVDNALNRFAWNIRSRSMKEGGRFLRQYLALALLLLLPFLNACSGGSGASTESRESAPGGVAVIGVANVTYSGIPAAANQQVRDFKLFFWDEVVEEVIGCADCHMQGGVGTVKFARNDDINQAYGAALSVVDLTDPGNSAVVNRVANGHNCWSGDLTDCRDTLTAFVAAWAAGVEATVSTTVNFVAPVDQIPQGSVVFPDTSSLFETTVYELLTANCAGCHSDSAPIQLRQTPLFAHSDVDVAYEAAKAKMDLTNTANSRLVVRLRDEAHNCWSGDCAVDAQAMQEAIDALLPDIAEPVDENLVTSLALRLDQGIQAASGGRIETHVIAQYKFRNGTGNLVADTSGVSPLMPLTLLGDYEWLDNWGVQFENGRAQASVSNSRKLYNEIGEAGTGEYTIEAWVFPENVTQDDSARIVSYSGGDTQRNFTLGQSLYNYDFLNRSSETDGDGRPMLSTLDGDEDAQAALQHVVLTFHPEDGRKIYVNGELRGDGNPDPETGAVISSWDRDFVFVIGNEVSGNKTWKGAVRFVAIHKRALSLTDIQANFDVGVGQKFFMLFRLATLTEAANPNDPPVLNEMTSTDNSYIVFEVSQYDKYSYLFSNPYYLVLGGTTVQAPFDLVGMRVGVNGKISPVGQAFTKVDIEINAASYNADTGQPISSQGMLVVLENGATQDQFFLTFDRLAGDSNVFSEANFPDPVFSATGEPVFNVFVRNFAEVRESFAVITGVSSTNTAVAATYDTVVQQLPSSENIGGFLSSHQMGVTQLAISYCDQLMESTPLRTALFPALNFNADANSISDIDWENQFMFPMIDKALNTNLTTQIDRSAVRDELHVLLTSTNDIKPIVDGGDGVPDGIARCGGVCPAGTTATAAKAGCAAVLGSAAVLLQ